MIEPKEQGRRKWQKKNVRLKITVCPVYSTYCITKPCAHSQFTSLKKSRKKNFLYCIVHTGPVQHTKQKETSRKNKTALHFNFDFTETHRNEKKKIIRNNLPLSVIFYFCVWHAEYAVASIMHSMDILNQGENDFIFKWTSSRQKKKSKQKHLNCQRIQCTYDRFKHINRFHF